MRAVFRRDRDVPSKNHRVFTALAREGCLGRPFSLVTSDRRESRRTLGPARESDPHAQRAEAVDPKNRSHRRTPEFAIAARAAPTPKRPKQAQQRSSRSRLTPLPQKAKSDPKRNAAGERSSRSRLAPLVQKAKADQKRNHRRRSEVRGRGSRRSYPKARAERPRQPDRAQYAQSVRRFLDHFPAIHGEKTRTSDRPARPIPGRACSRRASQWLASAPTTPTSTGSSGRTPAPQNTPNPDDPACPHAPRSSAPNP